MALQHLGDINLSVLAPAGTKDDFYMRHLIRNQLLDPVMGVFFANGERYNLLNSAVLELVEFIRKENIKVRTCAHVL
jgi:protein phosphatase-4 regulatory subunit 3